MDKERVYSSRFWSLEDNYYGTGDGEGGVVPSTTHLYPQEVTFLRDRLRTITQDLHLMLVMVMMVNVVWTLGPATLPPKELIVGFMVVILYHLRVGNINP